MVDPKDARNQSQAHREDALLDALLNESPAPAASDDLKARLLSDFDALAPGLHAAATKAPSKEFFQGLLERLLPALGLGGEGSPAGTGVGGTVTGLRLGAAAALGAIGFAVGLFSAPAVGVAPFAGAVDDEEAIYYAELAVDAVFGVEIEEDALWDVD